MLGRNHLAGSGVGCESLIRCLSSLSHRDAPTAFSTALIFCMAAMLIPTNSWPDAKSPRVTLTRGALPGTLAPIWPRRPRDGTCGTQRQLTPDAVRGAQATRAELSHNANAGPAGRTADRAAVGHLRLVSHDRDVLVGWAEVIA